MKKLLCIIAAVLAVTCCEKEPDDGQKKKVYVLDSVTESSVSVNDDATYRLEATLKGQGFYVTISMNSNETSFPSGTFQSGTDGCRIGLNDGQVNREVTSSSYTITYKDGQYSISVSILSKSFEYNFEYKGAIAFNTNLEISENTIFVTEGNATRFDMSTWQDVIISGVSKYTLAVMDPSDNILASIEVISSPGKKLADLEGDYAVKSSTVSGSINAGAVNWGNGSGSFYNDNNGVKQYITSGSIKISGITSEDGVRYYSVTGSGISAMTLDGKSGSGSLALKNMQESDFKGTVIRNRTVNSQAMRGSMKYSIYLPGDYDGTKTFPVLYLLHGAGDENNAWLDKGLLMQAAMSHEKKGLEQMIVVCPDALLTFYYDSPETKFKTYFFEELVPEIEKTYKVRTDRNSRAVAGLSMGGYGTLYYGLAFPDKFCYAYACSAAIDIFMDGMPSLYDLASVADPADLPGITIEMGTEDYTTGNGANFHNELNSLGIQHEYIARSGTHDWKFWQECLPKILNRCAEAFDE